MKYYLTHVKHIKDESEARECLGIADIIVAKATAFKKQGNAMDDPNCDYAFTYLTNHLGQKMIEPLSFVRPTEEVED